MPVEDDAEEVPGLPLVPVARRVHADQRGDMPVGIRRAHLEPDPAVVRDGHEVIHRVQLTVGVLRVVHAGHAGAQLEPERRVVAQLRRHLGQPLPADVQGQLAPVHDHALDRVGEAEPVLLKRAAERVGHRVEVGAVRPLAVQRRRLEHPEPAEAGGVSRGLRAEHAGADDRLGQPLLARPRREVVAVLAGGVRRGRHGSLRRLRPVSLFRPRGTGGTGGTGRPGHSCDPSGEAMCSGDRPSRAFSSSVICRSRFAPSFMLMILSCSLRIESSSISGRGGQPGR
jgi:hypothetical protein